MRTGQQNWPCLAGQNFSCLLTQTGGLEAARPLPCLIIEFPALLKQGKGFKSAPETRGGS